MKHVICTLFQAWNTVLSQFLERVESRLKIATKLCELRDYKQFSIIRGKTYELNFVLWLKSKHSFWFRSMLNRWLERFQDKSSTIWLRSIWQRDSVNCKFIVGSMKVVHSNWVPQYISKKLSRFLIDDRNKIFTKMHSVCIINISRNKSRNNH